MLHPIMLGDLSQYRGIDGKDVAQAMIGAAKLQSDPVQFYRWKEMTALL